MKLNKVIQIEADNHEIVDYLRSAIKYSKYTQGDAIEVISAKQSISDDLLSVTLFHTSKPRYHATVGMVGVVDRYDASDNTYLCLFVNFRGNKEWQWMKDENIRLWQKMPSDWVPSELSKEFLRSDSVMREEIAAREDPLSDDVEEEISETGSPTDPVAEAVARAEAGVASGAARAKR